ncbi:response regulator [Patescibacteria group bacterium]|nr:response regulator [Patescibacteria group bacterium]MDE1946586.1 response regulator [Patescibacteria group bacterium]MDE2010851.1 response regulator [Patescibacteria group bacterium]MDE2233213.1 response regulator [Patescibacteria group bacterium]
MNRSLALVVSTEKDLRELIAHSLSRLGYQVEIHSDVEQAYQFLTQNDVSLTITDIDVGHQNAGLALCRSAKELSPFQPIIIMSDGVANDGDRINDAGGFYLTKPFSLTDLKSAISGPTFVLASNIHNSLASAR